MVLNKKQCLKFIIAHLKMRKRLQLFRRNVIDARRRFIVDSWRNRMKACKHFIAIITRLRTRRTRTIGYHYRYPQLSVDLVEQINDRRFSPEFRISRSKFKYICEMLRSDIAIKPNVLSLKQRKASVEEKVAITIYKLKSCAEYQVVGNIFGYAKCTVHKIFYQVVASIVRILVKHHIRMPDSAECRGIATAFEAITGIPQIVGAIDGTHIPVTVPSEGRKDFVNRKGFTSIVLQAVVDNKCLFRDISCMFPGNVHDSVVLKGSSLFHHHKEIFPRSDYLIKDVKIPHFLLGDPAYPLLPWILIDYPGTSLEEKKLNFNERLNRGRVKVEQAFGMLKSCWRMLSRRSDVSVSFMPNVVAACCCLHNIILKEGPFESVEEAGTYEDFSNLDGTAIRNAINDFIFQTEN